MFVMERIDKASLKQVASSLTLTTLLSIVPALAVIMATFSAFPLFAPYREAFEQFIFSTLLPEQYSDQILGYIKQFATQAAGLTAFGLIGLMVSALLCIATIDSALNSTYEVLKLRSLWQRVLMYWALLTLGPVAIGISLAASSYLTGMAMSGHLSVYAQWLIPIGQLIFQSIILAALYKYVPNCRVLWRDALVGGILIALVFTVFRWGFGIYVMRKPGTGLIAELLAAVLECLYGNYFGPIIILSGLVQGLGFELIIALKRYKKFDRMTMIQGAVICSVLTLIYNLFISGYNKIAIPVLAIMLVVRIISAIVFDGFITPMLADGLVKAGVLKGYAVAQAQDADLED